MGSHICYSIVVRLTEILCMEIRRIDHQLHEDLLNRVDIYLPNVSLNVLILLAWSASEVKTKHLRKQTLGSLFIVTHFFKGNASNCDIVSGNDA
jgi:hypothetical protein